MGIDIWNRRRLEVVKLVLLLLFGSSLVAVVLVIAIQIF